MTHIPLPHTHKNVFLLLPNIVEYVRLIFLLFAVIFAKIFWLFCLLGAISMLLDALDGFLARTCSQESKLGYILDFTIDRISLLVVVFVYSYHTPQYMPLFCVVLLLDISSHFFYLYAAQIKGMSHKSISCKLPKLLQWYYGKPAVLFMTCFGDQLFMVALVFNQVYPSHTALPILCASAPFFIYKTVVHLLQIRAALSTIAEWDIMDKKTNI